MILLTYLLLSLEVSARYACMAATPPVIPARIKVLIFSDSSEAT